MEIALQSIFILFFVALPGTIFRRFYYQGEFTKQFDSKGWSYSLFLSLIFGLGIHIILILVFYHNEHLLSLNNLNELVCSFREIKEPNFDKDLNYNLLFWYFGLLFIAPIFLGYAFHSIIRLLNLDIKYSIFRFSNYWHYYFKGEIRKHRDFSTLSEKKNNKVFLTHADILCKDKENENVLYSGVLSQYTICKQTGRLDYIYLTLPNKYGQFLHTNESQNKKPMNSDCLILSRDSIININLNYLLEENKYPDYGRLFRTILFILYFINWIEPITINEFGLNSSLIIKLMRHLLIFSFVNAIHSSVSKNMRGDSRVGFIFLFLICLTGYLLSRSFLSGLS